MEILNKRRTVKAPPETFTGDAWHGVIVKGEAPSRMPVNVVRFAPGACNAWHRHALDQTLHLSEGRGPIQARGEVIEVGPGDTIHTPPGQWPWHGAAPDHFTTRLAMWEAPERGLETECADQVTDDEYRQR